MLKLFKKLIYFFCWILLHSNNYKYCVSPMWTPLQDPGQLPSAQSSKTIHCTHFEVAPNMLKNIATIGSGAPFSNSFNTLQIIPLFKKCVAKGFVSNILAITSFVLLLSLLYACLGRMQHICWLMASGCFFSEAFLVGSLLLPAKKPLLQGIAPGSRSSFQTAAYELQHTLQPYRPHPKAKPKRDLAGTRVD